MEKFKLSEEKLNFSKLSEIWQNCTSKGIMVIPVVIQEKLSGEVLWIGYTNDIALKETMATNKLVLWSTSRNELWHKGKFSGAELKVLEIRVNCENNSLLYLVQKETTLGSCHQKDELGQYYSSCYHRLVTKENI